MGFLILDTDKQSTGSLRMQLDAIGEGPAREVSDASAYARLRARRLPPPDVVFLDQDGDPERVESFRQELEAADPASVVVYVGTERASRMPRPFDFYLRKPVFSRKLEAAIVASYARGQERRCGLGYIGGNVPPGLVHELPHVSSLWRQIVPLETKAGSARLLGRLGALFVIPASGGQPYSPEVMDLARGLHRYTSASRILLIGVGSSPEETRDLRNYADYFVPPDADWKTVLRGLARRRLNRLASGLALKKARSLVMQGKPAACERGLERAVKADPWNLSLHGRLAELALSAGKYRSAERSYRRILELNPCQPRAYLRLLEIERKLKGPRSEEILARAKSYCPKVPAIQEFEMGLTTEAVLK